MNKITRIVGLSGSLRKASFNTALLHASAGMMPGGAELTVRTLHGIPLYNGDDEAATGIPPAVSELKGILAEADGLLLSTPEYNNSMPGVFKNAIDWLSRASDDSDKVFGGKPVAIMGASPGPFGTILSQNAWLPVLRSLGTRPWCGGRLLLSKAQGAFDPQGVLIDESARKHLREFLEGFVRFVQAG
jgi:NAD(P)H-dependent FMN reductase